MITTPDEQQAVQAAAQPIASTTDNHSTCAKARATPAQNPRSIRQPEPWLHCDRPRAVRWQSVCARHAGPPSVLAGTRRARQAPLKGIYEGHYWEYCSITFWECQARYSRGEVRNGIKAS